LLAWCLLNFLEKSLNGYFEFLTNLGLEQAREPKEGGGKHRGGSSALHSGLPKEVQSARILI